MADAAVRRCAIYTRKSSEEGLEQDYNSLHAQREACERSSEARRARARSSSGRPTMTAASTLGAPLIDGAKVHFVYYDSAAVRVAVAGEFNDWAKNDAAFLMPRVGETGLFFHTLTVPGATRLEYKFLVDGEWKIDPLCQHRVASPNRARF
jgi:1,4-alpha-glucan branching enzyme